MPLQQSCSSHCTMVPTCCSWSFSSRVVLGTTPRRWPLGMFALTSATLRRRCVHFPLTRSHVLLIRGPISSVAHLVRSETLFQELMRQSHGCAILVKSQFPSACPVFLRRASLWPSLHVSKMGPVCGRRCPATGAAANACTVELDKGSTTEEHAAPHSTRDTGEVQPGTNPRTALGRREFKVLQCALTRHESACESRVKTTTTRDHIHIHFHFHNRNRNQNHNHFSPRDSVFDDLTQSVSMGHCAHVLQHHKPQANSYWQERARFLLQKCKMLSHPKGVSNQTTVCPESPLQRENQANLVSQTIQNQNSMRLPSKTCEIHVYLLCQVLSTVVQDNVSRNDHFGHK